MKKSKVNVQEKKIAVIGLGFVGLSLAVAFGKKYRTIGIDINPVRIEELKEYKDKNNEVSTDELRAAHLLSFSNEVTPLEGKAVYIIAVPTLLFANKMPNLDFLTEATKSVAKVLKRGDIVIFESTVYPGCTENHGIPLLEDGSSLKLNVDFFVGYSPERINPGDKVNTFNNIVKITSGSTDDIAKEIDQLYHSVIEVGTYLAPSIRVAEAAKIFENTQRYVNISLMNEWAMYCDKVGLDIKEVLGAAQTKWNFHPYYPGIIGGPCLETAAQFLLNQANVNEASLKIVQAAIDTNEQLLEFVVQKIKKLESKPEEVAGVNISSSKPGCPTLINEKVVEIMGKI